MNLSAFIQEFKAKKQLGISKAEDHLSDTPAVLATVRETLHLESKNKKVSPVLLSWLYECAVSRSQSRTLFSFVTQLIPDLIVIYLQSVVDNVKSISVPTEAVLFGILKQVVQQQTSANIPSLSRPSVYHQTTVRMTQPSLTETALLRHNQSEPMMSAPHSKSFTDTEVTASNRLLFITVAMETFNDNITSCLPSSLTTFCNHCTRIATQGMHSSFVTHLKKHSSPGDCVTADELTRFGSLKRLPSSDSLISTMLHGLRVCLFQSCHNSAQQAIRALQMRAEYEVFPVSMQVSSALLRIDKEVSPFKLPLDPSQHMTYSEKDQSNWTCRPVTVMRSFTGQVLHSRLHFTPSKSANFHYNDIGNDSFDGVASLASPSSVPVEFHNTDTGEEEEDEEEESEEDDQSEYLTPTEVGIEFKLCQDGAEHNGVPEEGDGVVELASKGIDETQQESSEVTVTTL